MTSRCRNEAPRTSLNSFGGGTIVNPAPASFDSTSARRSSAVSPHRSASVSRGSTWTPRTRNPVSVSRNGSLRIGDPLGLRLWLFGFRPLSLDELAVGGGPQDAVELCAVVADEAHTLDAHVIDQPAVVPAEH